MNLKNREIETFELSSEYYEESFLNGNRNHVAEELSELMLTDTRIAQGIILELPKDIAFFVINSKHYNNTQIKITQSLKPY